MTTGKQKTTLIRRMNYAISAIYDWLKIKKLSIVAEKTKTVTKRNEYT